MQAQLHLSSSDPRQGLDHWKLEILRLCEEFRMRFLRLGRALLLKQTGFCVMVFPLLWRFVARFYTFVLL
jgi:hypothetical protein